MNLVTTKENGVVITLKEITDLIGVEHNKAMKKVKELVKEDGFGHLAKMATCINIGNGATRDINTYGLTKKQAIAVGARLNTTMLMKVINRLEELETTKSTMLVPNFSNPAEAARAWALEYEQKQLAQYERDIAIQTKAYISDKKTATALNTASQATKKANKLEIELDKSKEYCTIKRMTMLKHGQAFKWKPLKDTSIEMGIPSIDVFDANYSTVKAYHKDVWLEAYGLEF